MSEQTSTRVLDHIVHLTPPGTVNQVSEQFRGLGFTVIPGGTHAGGLTENALVILSDGAYLELISFVHEPSYYPPNSSERRLREAHRWASKKPGWIDYAFHGNGSLSEGSRISDIINKRAEEAGIGEDEFRYEKEVEGGRERPDGKILKWLISSTKNDGIGTVPFFCGDVTPREWRVPLEPSSNTEHPSSAQGVAYVRVLTSRSLFASTIRHLTAVVGDQPIDVTDSQAVWLLDTPHPLAGSDEFTAASASVAPPPSSTDVIGHLGHRHLLHERRRPKLILALPTLGDQEEVDYVAQSGGDVGGIFEVAFWVEKGKKEEGSTTTPYGRIRWIHG